jgi:hypothetical protein
MAAVATERKIPHTLITINRLKATLQFKHGFHGQYSFENCKDQGFYQEFNMPLEHLVCPVPLNQFVSGYAESLLLS